MNPTSTLADSTLGEGAVDSATVTGETGRGRGGRRAGAGGEGVEEGNEETLGRSTALKRSTLTDAQKYEICVYLKETDDGGEEKMTHRAVTNYILHRYNVKVDTSTISRLRKSSDKRLSHESPNPFLKRHRAVTFPELERRLTHYIESNRGETRITDSMIVGKGKELRDELEIAPELLSFSAGWLSKFKIRNGLKVRQSDNPQPQQTLLPYQQQQQQHRHSFVDDDNTSAEDAVAVVPAPGPMVISHGSSPGSTRLRTKPTPTSNTSTEQGTPSKRRIRARRGVDKDAINLSPRPSPSAASPLLHSPSPPPPPPLSPVLNMVETNTIEHYDSQSASDISDMDVDLERGSDMEDDADIGLPTDHLQPTLPTLEYSNNNYGTDIRGESPSVSVSDRHPKSNPRAPIAHGNDSSGNGNGNVNTSGNPSPFNVVRRGHHQGRPQALLSKIARMDAELSLSPASILDASVNMPIPTASNTTSPLPFTIPLDSNRREPALRLSATADALMTPFVGQSVPPTPMYIQRLDEEDKDDEEDHNQDQEEEEEEEEEEEGEGELRVDFKEAVSCINTLRIFMEQQGFEMDQVHHLQQIYLAVKRKRQSVKPSGS